MEITTIFSTAYFPPVNYFHELLKSDHVLIETHENYVRQTYRNRCQILSSNGKLNLSFPVKHISGNKESIQEIEIDYSSNWKKIHVHAIKSAYGKSPYFHYYADDLLAPLIDDYQKSILQLNNNILENILRILKINKSISFTENFQKNYPEQIRDYRSAIHPKKESIELNSKSYIQTFNDRFGFIPNLSIIDLIFNLGPDSYQYLIT